MCLPISSFFRRLLGQKERRVLMAGLRSAGKTTILYKLKLNEVVTTTPTMSFNVETFVHKKVAFTVWDVSPPDIRASMRHYYENSQGLIFVVDADNRNRIAEARDELHRMLVESELPDAVPVLVFANKQDLPNAMNDAEITDRLGLNSIRQRNWHVQKACATSGEGLYAGLEWLSNNMVG